MAKKMIQKVSVLIVLLAFITACSSKEEYTNVIPADASIVASINVETLAKKAGINDKDNEVAKQKLLNTLKSGMGTTTFETLEKIIKNPAESGIDFSSPIYHFSSRSLPYPSILYKVDKEENIRKTIEALVKEQICQPIKEENGINYSSIYGKLVAFNNTALLMIDAYDEAQIKDAKICTATLFKQTKENSIHKVGCFNEMQKKKGDICFFGSMAAIPSEYSEQMKLGLPADVNPEEIMVIGDITFDKGKVSLQAENYSENNTIKQLLDKQKQSFKKLNNSFTKYLPASTLLFFNCGVKGDAIYDLLSKNENMRKYIPQTETEKMKDLFKSFNGDISGGLINVTMNKAPSFVAYAEAENALSLDLLYKNRQNLGLKKSESIIQLSKNEYVYKNKEMNLFFGFKTNYIYATNDEMLYKSIGKEIDKSIKDAPYIQDMKDKEFFMSLNIEAILDLPLIKMILGSGNEEINMYNTLASKISYASMSIQDEVFKVDLCLKDKEVNALKQIILFAKQFAGM